MKTDWNCMALRRVLTILELLAHSNYEDGLKRAPHLRKRIWIVAFGAFQLWRRIETWFQSFETTPKTPFGAFQLWRRIETKAIFSQKTPSLFFWRIPIMKTDWNISLSKKVSVCYFAFGAFQLWRRIETKKCSGEMETGKIFWRIPIMKTDWNGMGIQRTL